MPWKVVNNFSVLEQSQAQSCGYCCAGIVLNLVDPTSPTHTEHSLVAAGKALNSGAYDRAAKDRVGAMPTPLIAAAYQQKGVVPHWGSGTFGNHLTQLLRDYRIDATFHTSSVKSAMRSVTAAKPLIVLVRWNKGGGHWVVVQARSTRGLGQASDYTILDPGGHVVINRGSTNYDPPYNQTGVFANSFVKVNRILPMPKGVKMAGL